MKLISCYIKGFGKLTNKDINFDLQGITSFVEENGFGKSTLAAFIKAMLFGMDTVRETDNDDKEFKDRKHFAPFNGSDFGGTITFIHNKKEYRVERNFDKKSSAKDTGKIYVDGVEIPFDDKIGETLLKLNKEAFERLLFINSEDTKMKLQGNIRQQLNNLIDTTIDGIDYDEVKEKIEELQKKYKGKRDTGLIPEVEKRIKDNKIKIDEKTQIYNGVSGKIDELKKEKENLNIYKAKRDKQNSYQGFFDSLNDKKNELNIIIRKYPNGVPSLETINELQQLEQKKIEVNGSLNRITNKEDYLKLKNIFLNGVPTEDEISELENINAIVKMTDDDKALITLFDKPNVDIDYKEANKLFAEYKDLDEKIKSIPTSSVESSNKPKATKIPLVLLILGTVIAVTGVSLIAISLIPVIVLCAIGLLLIVLAGFFYLKNKIDTSSNFKSNINNTDQIKYLNEIKEKTSLLFKQYDICVDSVELGFDRFKDKYNRYNEIKLLEQNSSKDNQRVFNIYNKYSLSKDYDIAQLKTDVNSFITYKNDLEKLNKELDLTLGKITNILEEYKIKDLYIENIANNIKRDKENINNLNQRIQDLNASLKDVNKDTLINNYDQLIDETNKKIFNLNADIKRCQTASEEIEEIKAELEDDATLLNKYKHRYEIINKTKSMIEESQKSLDKKYVSPIKNKLDNYFKFIEASSSSIQNIILGKDFDIQLDINGEVKSSEHLSSGQKSICALCYRLALLDNIFSNKEFPFIIMDDPFVSLDSNNFKMVSKMLKTISKQKQIIYFSCHDSRKV